MHLSAPRARAAAWIALPVAVVASGAIIASASYAAFSASTENAANSWASGKVTISDDDNGQALFDVNGLMPGQDGERCLTVTADTTTGADVKLLTANTTDQDGLGDAISMVVERGSLTTPGDCDSFTGSETVFTGSLSALTAATSFANGFGSWSPAPGQESTVYRIHYEMPLTADNSVQDASASTTFVWEAQQR
jgi:hypothetical protein